MTKMPENVFFTSGDGKALAPIFGKKKPRQALLAHPNNSQTRPAPTASYGGQNVPGTYEQNQPSGYGFKKSTVPSQPRIVPNSGSIQHSRPDQRSSAMTQSRPGQNSGFVPQSRPYQAQPQSRPYQPPSRPLQQGGIMGQSRAPQQSSMMTQSRPGQSTHQSGFMQPARQGQGQMNGMMSDRSSGMPVTPRSTRPQQRESVQMSPMTGQQAWGSPAKPPQSKSQFSGGNYSRGNQPTQSVHQTGQQGSQAMKPVDSIAKTAKSDTSLRVLTGTVNTLQRWSQYKQKINLMFEIFGVLNSAVLTPDRATAKEFMLKDDTGVIKCIFYQIDRDLSRMTRGRLYRCVGTLDVNTMTLKCVSVRPTSIEERDRSKMFISASDAAMVDWVKSSREM